MRPKIAQEKATLLLLIANIALYLVMAVKVGGLTWWSPTAQTLIDWGGNFGPLTLDGQYWRLLTHAFLHGNLMHLGINMYVLASIGPDLEKKVGPLQFLVIYFLSAVAGAIASVAWQPTVVSAGASGAIFGVFGALVIAQKKLVSAFSQNPKQKLIILGVFILLNIAFAFMIPGIDNAAHTGGFVAGLILGLAYRRSESQKFAWLRPVSAILMSATLAGLFAFTCQQLDKKPLLVGHREFLIGTELMKSGKMDEAIGHLDKAEKLAPSELAIRITRAHLLIELERTEDALNEIEEALKQDSDNSVLLSMRGMAYSQLGQYDKAEESYKDAIAKNPGADMLYNNLAWSQLSAGKPDKALENVNKSLSGNEENYAAFDTRGLAYHMLDKPNEAIADLNRAATSNQSDGAAFFHRALTLLSMQEEKQAAKDYKLACNKGYKPDRWEEERFADQISELRALTLKSEASDDGKPDQTN